MDIRQAKQSDSNGLASLIFSSAPTILSAVFDVDDEYSAMNFLQTGLLSAEGQYGYANHWVCEINNQIVGCLSAWHSDLPDSFHQATLSCLATFYGMSHALPVVQASQALQDCIPKPTRHEWCIGHFAVLPEYQKQGVGSALLKLMHEQALSSGKLALSLDVDSANTQAIDFYLKQGFVQQNKSAVSPRMESLGVGSHLHLSKTLV